MSDLLFVYGTLRRASGHPMRQRLEQQAVWLGPAWIRARLFRVADYPGAILSVHPDREVKGDLWRIKNPGHLLVELDRYEECGPGFAKPTEYIRQLVESYLPDGRTVTAWCWLYNRPVRDLPVIPGGDFFADKPS